MIGQYIEVDLLTWDEAKSKINDSKTNFTYLIVDNKFYEIRILEGLYIYKFYIWLDSNTPGIDANSNEAWKIDFETNYKPYLNFAFPSTSVSKGSLLTTPLVHRKNLTFKQVGFYFTTNTVEPGTYDAKTKEVNVTQTITAGTNVIAVDSIRYAAPFFQVTIYEGGLSETKTIYAVDTINKTITFTSALTNSYTTAAKVKIDLVKAALNGQKLILDYYITENHSDPEYQGIDVNGLHISGNFVDGDRIPVSFIWHPYYTAAVNLGTFFESKVFLSKDGVKDVVAPTTITIKPGLVMRFEFEANDLTQRLIVLDLDLWRQ